MASIYRHGSGYRAQVYVAGVRDSTVKPTRTEAAQWALQREAELSGRRLPDKSFGDALALYARDEAPTHKGARWELVRLTSLGREKFARHKLAGMDSDDFALWRDARLKEVKPGTVAREMNLIRSVLEFVRKPPHRWIRANPMKDVDWPTVPKGRRRRVQPEEVTAVRLAFGVGKKYQAKTQTNRVGLAFLFALETAMRSGEICALDWKDVHLAQRYLVLPATKNGDRREVPLSTTACTILRALPGTEGKCFDLEDALRDSLWRKARPASLGDLHFHDSRGEAIWRLSKKLDVLQLAQVIGHRDLKSLMIYYRESAADLAKRLG
jgi:integrase